MSHRASSGPEPPHEPRANGDIISRFRVAGMDCAAEEQLVRLSLASVAGIESTDVDLEERTVTVTHRTETVVIKDALDALSLGTSWLSDHETAQAAGRGRAAHGNERKALATALVINAAFFVAELTAGVLSRSMGLIADSLDMLADASVYVLSLLAVGGPAVRKRRLARGSGYLQLALAVGGLVEVSRRLVTGEGLPDVATMIVVATLALGANVATLVVLSRAQSHEAHFQASWIFTANDVKVNALVIVSAILVALLDHPAPDLLAGALIFAVVANGARRILQIAR